MDCHGFGLGFFGGLVVFFFSSGPISVLKTQYTVGNLACKALAQNIVNALSLCVYNFSPSLLLAAKKKINHFPLVL